MPILCSSIWELSYDKVHREKALSETSDTLRSLELIGSRSRVEVGALIATEIERDGTRIKWLSQMNLDLSSDRLVASVRCSRVIEHNNHATGANSLKMRREDCRSLLAGLLIIHLELFVCTKD